ncbi:MAG: glycosyltransferase [Oscillospiraceae bacterium]|nr:glycosyltransferase [Oscillospiraceae bacterium]
MKKQYDFSVVIPAHNEEQYIAKCLRSIKHAAREVPDCSVQVIVAANRCTDRTAEIAARFGAKVVENHEKCIAAIRNTGVRAADGDIIVTIDADSIMTKDALKEIRQKLNSGRFIGGGTRPEFDRMSPGILVSALYIAFRMIPAILKSGGFLSGAMFWFRKDDFEAIGGFDESLVSLEDLDFASRLMRYGKQTGRQYGTLKKAFVITSSRKFDEFGDWYLLKNRKLTKALFTGKDRAAADRFYYDVR